MTVEVMKKLRQEISSMPVEPPWCENAGQLKKWVEGYEHCLYSALRFIDSAIKNDDRGADNELDKPGDGD